ncbi:hypothetical protein Dsin_003962 [Dipteronia sinensis]|uniref:MADS-box domain-containing protein n=1 Tax=Dipteronia sinensis TaxID=43782 RepID=A0AAE0B926_9ROSI|nr:hypothetical protein Dsin_003962 [Dipteronia sinensis]
MNANKKTKGRQKLEIKKVEHEAKREVTFSKRKKGLFNKASELCELCELCASRNVLHGLNGVREQYNDSLKRLEEEEKKSKDKKSGTSSGGFWWDDQEIENFNELDELEQYVESMEKLRKIVQARVDEIDLSGNYFEENLAN